MEKIMNNLKKQLILSCAAIGFSSFALLANAQEQPWTSCNDQVNKEECRSAQMTKFRAAREAKLHDELKITAEQEPAWKSFTDTMSKARHEKFSRADADKMSAPQRLEKKLDRMEKHQAAMQTRLVALKTLYAKLTPEQQTLLNKRLAEFEKHRHHRQGGRDQKQSSEKVSK
jgi:Spy/CpxP family protein refolding chaperone